MSRPSATIIVPAYNCAKTLEKCLDSILEQDFRDFELLIVFTPGDDETLDIIKRFNKLDPRVRWVIQKRRGRGAARNLGIKKARTGHLVWTDSDCVVPKNWCSSLLDPLLKNKEIAVQGNEASFKKDFWSNLVQNAGQRHLKSHLAGTSYIKVIDTKNFAISRKVLNEVGGFNDRLMAVEDYELKLRLEKAGYKIRFLKNIRVKHNHKESLLGIVKQKIEQGYWTAIVYYLHKEYLDGLKETENTVEPMYPFYFLTGPFRLVRYTFTYGAADGLFILINAGCIVAGNFKGRMNRKKEIRKMKRPK